MADDVRQALQKVLDHCNEKWTDADKASASAWPPPDMLTGQKKAYNELFQYVRALFDEAS
jgi:hypothetical protein